MSEYKNKSLGSFGALSCLSFHETKNISCGEGGALLINDKDLLSSAEIIREKGTNRSKFFRGEIDKYSWVALGSSFLPSEFTAACLYSQLCEASFITNERLKLWSRYYDAFEEWEYHLILSRPSISSHCKHNAHMFYVLFTDIANQSIFLNKMKSLGIHCTSHYIPLHSSPKGLEISPNFCDEDFTITNYVSSSIVRLPLWVGLDIDFILSSIDSILCDFIQPNLHT